MRKQLVHILFLKFRCDIWHDSKGAWNPVKAFSGEQKFSSGLQKRQDEGSLFLSPNQVFWL